MSQTNFVDSVLPFLVLRLTYDYTEVLLSCQIVFQVFADIDKSTSGAEVFRFLVIFLCLSLMEEAVKPGNTKGSCRKVQRSVVELKVLCSWPIIITVPLSAQCIP